MHGRRVFLKIAAASAASPWLASRATAADMPPEELAIRKEFAARLRESTLEWDARLRAMQSSYEQEATQLKKQIDEVVERYKKLRKGTVADVSKNREKWDTLEEGNRLKAMQKVQADVHDHNYSGMRQRKGEVLRRLRYVEQQLLKKLQAGETVAAGDMSAGISDALRTEACPDCRGTGQVDCTACKGTGTIKRKTTCPDCLGQGSLPDNPSVHRNKPCTRCETFGRITLDMTCLSCFGTAKVNCDKCFGTGQQLAPLQAAQQQK